MRLIGFFFVFQLLAIISGQETPPLLDIPYGSDPVQKLDLHLPPGGVPITKVIVLLHGGSWFSGRKEDMNYLIPRFKQDFPTRAIVTLGYRLATIASPGFPKQVEDIRLALEYLRSTFTNDVTISLMGDSAGSHLCMLYAYSSQDPSVEAVVSKVGPADFSDPVYTDNPIYTVVLYNLVGQCDFADCPDTWLAASPVTHINSGSPPTIGFYGDVDIVVPTNQMPTLRDRLELFGVKSNFTVYHGGHVGWPDEHIDDMMSRVKVFFDEVESRE